MLQSIILLVLGWLFGLLTPIITRSVEQKRNILLIKSGIRLELSILSNRLANVYCLVTLNYGEFTKEKVHWAISVLEKVGSTANDRILISSLQGMLDQEDKEFERNVALQKAEYAAGLGVKKYQAPYLNSKIGQLSLLSEGEQRRLLDILANIQILNEEVDTAWYYFRLTYDSSLSEENHDRAQSSTINSYLNVANRSKIIVDVIITYLGKC